MALAAGGFDLGNAYARVLVDASGVDAGMDQARRAFDNGLRGLGDGLQGIGNQMTGLGTRISLLTAPIALFGAQGVQAASSFQDAMKEIEVRARLSGDEMERVRQKALEMGADTVFSAGQSAEAFLQLLTTGQSVEEAMQTIGAVMAGAAASGSDLGYVADAVTDIMAQFNLTADKSSNVVNALARAAGASSATMDDLIQGFQNVGGVANSFNLSIDDTAAILATFSENGIKGAEAGTQLRSMLNNMMRPTDSVKNAWAKLGTSMFDATGKMRPLNAVIADINRGMAGMTEQDRLETIQALAGTYGQLGLTALLNADGFGAMSEAMNDASDAQDVADAKMKTFSGSVENLRGSIETLQINALTPLMDQALAPMAQKITEVVNAINDWVVANPELAGQIVQVLAALVTVGPILVGAGMAINLIGTALSGLGTIIAVLTSPIALLIGAIAGVVYVLDQLGIIDVAGTFTKIRDAFSTFFDILGQGGTPMDAFRVSLSLLIGPEAANNIITPLETITGLFRDFGGTLSTAATTAQQLVGMLTILTLDGLYQAATAAQNLLNIIGLLVMDGLNRASIAAGQLLIMAGIGLNLGLMVLRTTVSNLVTGFQQWIDKHHLLWNAVTSLAIALGIATLALRIHAAAIAFAALVSSGAGGLAGALGAVRAAVLLLFTPVGALTLALAALIALIREFNQLQNSLNQSATAAHQALAPSIAGGLTREQIEAEVFKQLQAQFGDVAARLMMGSAALNIQGRIDQIFTGQLGQATGNQLWFGKDTGGKDIFSADWKGFQAHDFAGAYEKGMPYIIGQGAQPELFVPNESGYAVPNADRMMGGDTYNVSIVAGTYEGGAAAARGFEDEMRFRRRSRG